MENRRVIIQIGITILLLSILGWLLLNAEVIMDRQAQRSANDLAVLSERVQSRMAQLSASNRSLYQTSMSKLHAAGLSDKSGSRAIQGVRSERYSFQRQLQIELAVIECAAAGQGIEVEFKAGSTLRELDTPECSN